MDETMKNATTEKINENVNAGAIEDSSDTKNLFRKAIQPELKKVHDQGLLIGAKTMSKMVIDKIAAFKLKQGKPTMNDYKRLFKDIEGFCATSISYNPNADGEAEPVEETDASETVQN